MCYSANASLIAFILAATGQIALWKKGGQARALGVGLTSLTLMQLFEYIMWKNPCNLSSTNNANKYASRMAMVSNYAQPLTIAVSLLYFKQVGNITKGIFYASLAYSVLLLYVVLTRWNNVTCSAPTGISTTGEICNKSNCGLEWQWTSEINNSYWLIYFLFLNVCSLALLKPFSTAIIATGFINISLVFAFLLHGETRNIGSQWCFYAVALPWLLYFLPEN